MNHEIADYINQLQSGKSGIYPHWVAVDVAAQFSISLHDAREYVIEHIRQTLSELPG